MYTLQVTTQFKKDLKKVKKRPKDYNLTKNLILLLQQNGVQGLPQKVKPHRLIGEFKDNWECHIKPDLLIIWIQIEAPKTIKYIRLGSYADLFK